MMTIIILVIVFIVVVTIIPCYMHPARTAKLALNITPAVPKDLISNIPGDLGGSL